MSEAPQEAPKVPPVAPEKEAQKAKNLAQLAEARQKAKAKRAEREKRLQMLEQRLEEPKAAQEEPKAEPPKWVEKRKPEKVVESSESEDSGEDTKHVETPTKRTPKIVTRQPAVKSAEEEDSGPSFFGELQKTAIVGALSLASFYVANTWNNKRKAAAQPTQDTVPDLSTIPFPRPVPKQTQQPAFVRPEVKIPVGKSGFFR